MCNKNFSQYFIKHTYDLFKSNQLSYFYSLSRSIFRWLKNIIFRVIVCTFTLKDFPTQTCAIKISLNILLNTPTICPNWTNPTILFLFFDQEYLQVAQKCYLQGNGLYVYPKRFSSQTCAIKMSLNVLWNTPTICSNRTNPTILFLFFDQEYLQMAQKCYLQDNCLYVYPKRISHPNMCNKNVS